MGWGQEPHEGWADEKLPDGRWLGPTRHGRDPDPVARQGVCSCGWRSEREHPVCWEDWNAEHYQPLLGYEPHTQLILGRTEGGARHFLDGRAVHAGAALELLLDDGHWLSVRYEWSWQPDVLPTAHVVLGVPTRARELVAAPTVSFELPPRAILRWPERERSR